MASWIGYVCVFLYLMLGNYLLCDVDVFGVQNQQYGTAATLEKMKSAVLLDVQHLKEHGSDDGADVEMQEQRRPSRDQDDNNDTVQAIKSNLTSEAADWIPEDEESGSEGALSSSTAEADDYPCGSNPLSEKESTTSAIQDEAPQTESSVWRNAYNVSKTKQDKTKDTTPVDVDFDPTTASGVWRKAYHVANK